MNHKTHDFKTSYIDLLLNLLTSIIFVSILTVTLIAKKNDEGLSRKAEVVFTAEWNNAMDCDVDVWAMDPSGNITSYQHKNSGLMNLERDDLGFTGDQVIQQDGKTVKAETNAEYLVFRGLLPGKYFITTHLYSCKVGGISLQPHQAIDVPINTTLTVLNPSLLTLDKQIVTIRKVFDEQPVLSFIVDNTGKIVSVGKEPITLVKIMKESTPGG